MLEESKVNAKSVNAFVGFSVGEHHPVTDCHVGPVGFGEINDGIFILLSDNIFFNKWRE